jgi:hypothetical protein
VHERVHGGSTATCGFSAAAFLGDFWTTDDATAGFHKWRLTYFEALNAAVTWFVDLPACEARFSAVLGSRNDRPSAQCHDSQVRRSFNDFQ